MEKPNTLNDMHMPFSHFTEVTNVVAYAAPKHVPVKEAKAKLTELLRNAESGERIVLTRNGKPVADLVPHVAVEEGAHLSLLDRVDAWHLANPSKGIGWVAPDFDDPLPEDFLLQPLSDDFDARFEVAQKRALESRAR